MNFKKEKFMAIKTMVRFNKQFLLSVVFLVRHPIIIYIIITIIYGLLFCYLNNPYLCDVSNLDELNSKLTTHITEYNKLYTEWIHYDNLLSQAIYRPERNDLIVEYLSNKKINAFLKMSYKLNDIRDIESSVKAIKPNFISTIKKELYEYYF